MISIFAKPPYLLTDASGGNFLQRVSSRVRGEEIAQYLGAKLNPKSGYENDVCIYVKPQSVNHIKDGDYVDILDDPHSLPLLKTRSGIKVIAMSQSHFEFLKTQLNNELFLIPHHHVNFERVLRTRKKITTCGYIGASFSHHHHIHNRVKEQLAKIGLKFIPLFHYQTRQDIMSYYKKIDIQIIGYFDYFNNSPYRHPTKIINAASFGIPTIAAKILGYKEIENYYVPVENMADLVREVKKMKDKTYYNAWSDKIRKKAEKFHIAKIAKLYKNLK